MENRIPYDDSSDSYVTDLFYITTKKHIYCLLKLAKTFSKSRVKED